MTWSDTWFDTHFYSEDRNRHRTDQFCVRYALYYKRLFEDPKFIETLQKRWEMFRGSFMGVPMYI